MDLIDIKDIDKNNLDIAKEINKNYKNFYAGEFAADNNIDIMINGEKILFQTGSIVKFQDPNLSTLLTGSNIFHTAVLVNINNEMFALELSTGGPFAPSGVINSSLMEQKPISPKQFPSLLTGDYTAGVQLVPLKTLQERYPGTLSVMPLVSEKEYDINKVLDVVSTLKEKEIPSIVGVMGGNVPFETFQKIFVDPFRDDNAISNCTGLTTEFVEKVSDGDVTFTRDTKRIYPDQLEPNSENKVIHALIDNGFKKLKGNNNPIEIHNGAYYAEDVVIAEPKFKSSFSEAIYNIENILAKTFYQVVLGIPSSALYMADKILSNSIDFVVSGAKAVISSISNLFNSDDKDNLPNDSDVIQNNNVNDSCTTKDLSNDNIIQDPKLAENTYLSKIENKYGNSEIENDLER